VSEGTYILRSNIPDWSDEGRHITVKTAPFEANRCSGRCVRDANDALMFCATRAALLYFTVSMISISLFRRSLTSSEICTPFFFATAAR